MSAQHIERFPANRVATVDVGVIGGSRHIVAALFQADVTKARARLRASAERSGRRSTVTAWLIHVLATTLHDFPSVHAYPLGRFWRLESDVVDVSTVVEREVEGQKVPVPMVIRAADTLDVASLTSTMAEAKEGPLDTGASWLRGPRFVRVMTTIYSLLPGPLRRLLWRAGLSIPWLAHGVMGSVVVTSIGMMGRVDGWFVHTTLHPLSLGVGSIVRKPVVLSDNTIAPRDVVHLTLLMDHDVVDGADMARFVAAFSRNLEAAMGLPEGDE